ncbi:class I SAM-dependent methyltransferase [Methylophilaceae bacterium]|nr:class I SAM-dependent methyltransferase [Methylophilaceae bacterium]
MNYKKIKHENLLNMGSRYAANFDYLMHDYCLKKFNDLLRDKDVLELGCYHGEMTKKLSALCKSVTALDYDNECIDRTLENCSSLNNISCIKQDFMSFRNYKDFDIIYFSHSLEHVPDDFALLKIISNNMAAGQKIITLVPNGMSLSRQIAVNMGILQNELEVTDFEKSIGHFRTYEQSSLSSLFLSAGFKLKEQGGIMPKIFSNNQFDRCLLEKIISIDFLDALNNLSDKYQEICSSIYVVAEKE